MQNLYSLSHTDTNLYFKLSLPLTHSHGKTILQNRWVKLENVCLFVYTLIVLLVKSLVMLTYWQMLNCSNIDAFEVLIH